MKIKEQTLRATSSRGSALALVLWAIVLLSFLIWKWNDLIVWHIDHTHQDFSQFQARLAALSGLSLALSEDLPVSSSLLEKFKLSEEVYCEITIRSEGGRLNLNWLLAKALQDQASRDQFFRFLQAFDIPLRQRDPLIDALLDWVDPDDLARLNGIEKQGDYQTPNRFFLHLEEVANVRGAAALTHHPLWKESWTLWSQGPLDINEASPELLAFLPGFDSQKAESFVQQILGPDGERHTQDDQPFRSLEEVRLFLQLSPSAFSLLSPWITVKERAIRITAKGQSGSLTYPIEIIALDRKPKSILLYWQEP